MKRLVVALVVAAGCGGTTNNYYGSDGGVGGGSSNVDAAGTCTANAKECVTMRVGRVCAADGTGWVPLQCNLGEICQGGDCAPDPNAACNPGDGACTDATHGLVCNDNGMGFKMVTCPANTTCAGPGLCQGSCVVGESICLDVNTVATCVDGQKLTTLSCTRGTSACVQTGTTPIQTAACKPAACTPLPSGCDGVCGDKTAGATNTNPGFESFCTATPDGYKWMAVQCPSPTSCNPAGNACTGGGTSAACVSACTPGQTRCDGTGQGIQTCGADGNWGADSPCVATASGKQQLCVFDSSSGQPVCGDPLCGAHPGACEPDGFHACVNGKVAATATACTTGTCVADGAPIDGLTPGRCVAECKAGDSHCNGPAGYQTCVNGLWSSTNTACPSVQCFDSVDPTTMGPRAICGVCAPGTHRCTNSSGVAGPTGTDIEICSAAGQWSAHLACSVGQCQPSAILMSTDPACIAECVPNAPVCVGGAPAAPPNPLHPGQVAVVTCSSTGLLPAAPTAMQCAGTPPPAGCCPSGTTCRTGPSGTPVQSTNTMAACVVCVGPMITGGNEAGLVDTLCTTAGMSSSLQTCQNNNTWGTPSGCQSTCVSEAGAIGTPTCADCGGGPCSNSFLITITGQGCSANGLGNPQACGGVTDCCAITCSPAPPPPTPGFCQ
jgi:hypothetical protein